MASRFFLALLVFVPLACATPTPKVENPIVQLVPAESLATVFPAAVDSFVAVSDTVYLGYLATETDTLALITAARIYATPGGVQIAINLSSFDNREQFMAIYGEGAVRDTTASIETYDVLLGRLVLPDDSHAAEAKGFDLPAIRAALDLIDYERLASLSTAPIEVDSTFQVGRD